MNLDSELVDLIIQRSNNGLSPADQNHFDRLIQSSPKPDKMLAEIQRFELSIAAVELSYLADLTDQTVISDRLRNQIKDQSIDVVEKNGHQQFNPNVSLIKDRCSALAPPLKRSSNREIFSWVAAAASLLALALFIRHTHDADQSSIAPSVVGLRDQPRLRDPAPELVENIMPDDELMKKFLASTPEDLLTLSWSPVDNENVTGKVFWSDQQQTGFMTFSGLEINDPQQQQYQVWIYDTDTDQQKPVDGGVFDVAKSGHYVVPIAPRSPVKKAVQFAITTEEPGGVNVSQRKRVPMVASPPF